MSWQGCMPSPVETETLELFKSRLKSTSQLLLCTSWHSCHAAPLWVCPLSILAPQEASKASEEKAAGCGAWVAKAQAPCHLAALMAH